MGKTIFVSLLLLLTASCVFSIFYFKKVEEEHLYRVNRIGVELLRMDSISDFSSNRNKPVPDVENIGTNLYQILSFLPYSYDLEVVRGDVMSKNMKTRYGRIANYTLYIRNLKTGSRVALRIKYKKAIDCFQILGFSGSI